MTADVSVILPARGDSVHLRQAVASALACPETGELLLLPAAPDLDAALFEDPRVRSVPRKGTGVSTARNTGIEAARKPYLAFLDDDDVWTPDHLARALKMIRRHPGAVLTGCNAWLFLDDTENGSEVPPEDPTGLTLHLPGAAEEELTFERLLLGNPVTTPSVVLVAAHLRSEDRFDPDLSHMEDYDLWLRLSRDRLLVYDPQPSVLVRKRRGSASRDRRRMAEASLRVIARHLEVPGAEAQVRAFDLRSRLGGLWHELAYACFVEDDLPAGRRAARRSIEKDPARLKSYAHLLASYLPSAARRALFARARRGHYADSASSTETSRRETTSSE